MGRRLRYTEDEFREKSAEYISSIRYKRPLCLPSGEAVLNELGLECFELVYVEPPNTADWALYLGISKKTLTAHYRQRYPDVYEQVKTVLEAYNVRELLGRKTGAEAVKFNLQNNFGWRDTRSESDGATAEAASQPPLTLSEKLARIEELVSLYKTGETL